VGPKSVRLQFTAANCAVPPTASAGQYATSNGKLLLFGFPYKWWYIIVGTSGL